MQALCAILLAAATAGEAPEALTFAAAVRRIAADPVLAASARLREERDVAAHREMVSPTIGPFATVSRAIDNASPPGSIVEEEYFATDDFTRSDVLFGGVEMKVPFAGGRLEVRAGERTSQFRQEPEGIRNPNTTRFRTTAQLRFPLYPWRLDLDKMTEEQLLNEQRHLRDWAEHRRRVALAAGDAAQAAWRAAAIEAIDTYVAAVAAVAETAALLERYGEISPHGRRTIEVTAREVEASRREHESRHREAIEALRRFFGGPVSVRPPAALPAPGEIVLPPPEAATDVVVAAVGLELARRRARIARRETGAQVEFRGDLLSDAFQDVSRERLKTSTFLTVSIPFYGPGGEARRRAAEAEIAFEETRRADLIREAGAAAESARAAYAEALASARDAEEALGVGTSRLAIAVAEFEGYTDPDAVARLAQAYRAVAWTLNDLYRTRESATKMLVRMLVDAGVGVETIAGYLP